MDSRSIDEVMKSFARVLLRSSARRSSAPRWSARSCSTLCGSILWLSTSCALLAVTPASAQDAIPGAQWPSINNHLDGQRFSPLRQITPANVSRLGKVCRRQIDGPATYEAGLIVVNGTLYTDTGRETVALDARSCAVRWKYTYVPDDARSSPSNRGVAVMNGRVFRGTGDARLIALDAATGKLLWKDVIGTPELGESAAAAPLAWNGVVYIGIAGSELGVRGRVMAFDAQTGRELWRFNTIPMGRETGAATWKLAQTAKTGGGGVWGALSVDVDTGELFVPVGNPWPDIDKGYRPGSNLFTDSMVILDARTGALKWWYQVTANDWGDLDLVAAPVLYRAGGARDILAFAGKDGYITAVDRDTHQMIFRTPVTTIGEQYEAATPQGVHSCPGYAGGVEWNGPTLDRVSGALITGSVDACFDVKLGTTQYKAGALNFGGSVRPDGPITGWVTAVDAETGKVRWRYHAEKPVIAGVTPTAGGVTFTGDLAGNLLVFNSKTGELLRKVQTGGALAGGVVTYAVDGKQYVAFASGNISRSAFGALGLPSVVIMDLNGR
jgi:alcohol dehydrogenase (cytochrome c)